jgi:hypothetical protein
MGGELGDSPLLSPILPVVTLIYNFLTDVIQRTRGRR